MLARVSFWLYVTHNRTKLYSTQFLHLRSNCRRLCLLLTAFLILRLPRLIETHLPCNLPCRPRETPMQVPPSTEPRPHHMCNDMNQRVPRRGLRCIKMWTQDLLGACLDLCYHQKHRCSRALRECLQCTTHYLGPCTPGHHPRPNSFLMDQDNRPDRRP